MRLSDSFCGIVLIGGLLALSLQGVGRGRVSESNAQAKDAQRPRTEESSWQKVDAGAFSISAPSGWKFQQLQGSDSYVGEFTGDAVILKFDFGRYSSPFKQEKKPAYVVVHKYIGGLSTKIVSPNTPGHGITGIYFPKTFGSNKLSLFGQDLTYEQQELALKIFETIRFGNSVPSILPPPARDVH